MPDGTIIRTNKIYTTSEDGSSFFSFQSTSVNSFGHSSESSPEEKAEENNGVTMEYDTDDFLDDKTVSDTNVPEKEYEDVKEEIEDLDENVGVDEGLFNAWELYFLTSPRLSFVINGSYLGYKIRNKYSIWSISILLANQPHNSIG